MAFSTPPTFTDGNVLSASQLNTLASNQNHFAGLLGSTSNTGFMTEDVGTDRVSATWVFKRSRQYLHYRVDMIEGTSDRLKIFVNGNEEFNDGVNRTFPYSYTGYFDLTAITTPVSVGTVYEVYCDCDVDSSGTNTFRIQYFIESDNTSL